MMVAETFSVMDSVADATLSVASFDRYIAFRDALIADGTDAEGIVARLSAFLWDLFDGFSANGVH
jgi:hypothetical protein